MKNINEFLSFFFSDANIPKKILKEKSETLKNVKQIENPPLPPIYTYLYIFGVILIILISMHLTMAFLA